MTAPQPAPGQIGYLQLPAVDLARSAAFYAEVFGWEVDARGGFRAPGTLVLQLHHRDVEHHHGTVPGAEGPVGRGVLLWFGEVSDFDGVVARAGQLGAPVVRAPHRNPPEGEGNGPGHREIWIEDPDGYTVVVASPDGEAFEI